MTEFRQFEITTGLDSDSIHQPLFSRCSLTKLCISRIISKYWHFLNKRSWWFPKKSESIRNLRFCLSSNPRGSELSGQHCLGPVLVQFLFGFSGKFCLVSVRCPDFVKIRCPVSVCRDSVRCPDSVSIFQKKSVRCLSVRPDKDKTDVSGFSLSLYTLLWP